MTAQAFDIVIAGGGMVGATTALALATTRPDLSIAIVEAVEPKSDHQPSFDARAIAVAHGSKCLLDGYGLWKSLAEHGEAIHDIHVSDRGHIGKSQLNATQFDLKALGYVVEVRHVGNALIEQLARIDSVRWFCPAKIEGIAQSADHSTLTLSDGNTISAKLLLVADGGQSTTRQLLNIDNQVDDYGQVAVIANIACEDGHNNRAFERFTEHGPIALLPLTDNRYSLVWCIPPEKQSEVMALDDEAFIAQLQNAFGYRAGRIVKTGGRFCYPLALTLANQTVGHRVALIGNASHTIHPIAGQGFNLGLRDIEAMRAILANCQDDIGGHAMLRQFEQARKQDLHRVVTMTDSLVRLFSNDNRMLALGRTAGLLSMQFFDCLKQPLAYQAMGYSLVGASSSLR